MSKTENTMHFLSGVMWGIVHMHNHDSHVEACELAGTVGGISELRKAVKFMGNNEQDLQALKWLKTGRR